MSEPHFANQPYLYDYRKILINEMLDIVRLELYAACAKHPPFKSTHEGYAVILEEVDELWAEVKANNIAAAHAEAIQVAAMAVRFLMDCRPNLHKHRKSNDR